MHNWPFLLVCKFHVSSKKYSKIVGNHLKNGLRWRVVGMLQTDQSRVDVIRWSRVTGMVVYKLWNQYQKSNSRFPHDLRKKSPKTIEHAEDLLVLYSLKRVYIIASTVISIYTILWICIFLEIVRWKMYECSFCIFSILN